MRCSSWATSCAAMDDWNSDRSLHVDNVRVAHWCLRAIGYSESHNTERSAANKNPSSSTPTNNFSSAIFYFAFLTRSLYCSLKTVPPTNISFRGQLYPLFSFHSSFFSMNADANEFFPSSETGARSTAIDEQDLLFTRLRTNHQLATAQSILRDWNTATTLSALTREWSTRHENQPIERNGFSLVLYNISSLRMHLEDLMEHISASYPNIWALTGLHFNDDVNISSPRTSSLGTPSIISMAQMGSVVFVWLLLEKFLTESCPNSITSIISSLPMYSTLIKNTQWLLSILHTRKKSRLIFLIDCIGTIGI